MKFGTIVLITTVLLSMAPASATCMHDYIIKPVKSLLGAVIAIPVGSVSGLLRGGSAKGVDYAQSFPEDLGGGTIGDILGTPTGFVVGAATGGVSGLLNGAWTGLTKGLSDPLTKESMSITGDFIDYDPYDFD